ncbi:hypothetical protein [Actinoplanes sp. NPDC020271]
MTGDAAKETPTRSAIQAQIDEVDAIVHDIRATVFALHPLSPHPTPTRHP